MSKRINLLLKQSKYKELENFFKSVHVLIFALVGLFIVVYLVSFFILFQQQGSIQNLANEKQQLSDFLSQNKEAEAKFVYFRNKEKQITGILQNDVNFYPYYNLLNESLQSASPEPTLNSVIIDKDRTVQFTLGFTDISSLLSFFKFAESDQFLGNFESLILSNFNATTPKTSQQTSQPTNQANSFSQYSLQLSGKFKQINAD